MNGCVRLLSGFVNGLECRRMEGDGVVMVARGGKVER